MQVSGVLSAIVSAAFVLVALIVACRRISAITRAVLKGKVFIGILSGVVPDELSRFPICDKKRDAVVERSHIILLKCRTTSYALKHCDRVLYNTGDDFKLLSLEQVKAFVAIEEKYDRDTDAVFRRLSSVVRSKIDIDSTDK